MKTPICDFVSKYAQSSAARLHMPGHKGKTFLGIEHLDITEVEGADVLYDACGIIKESEENAAALFSSARTLYSAEGSTLAIRAMLYLALIDAKRQERAPCVLAGRNAHKAFMTTAALLDLEVDWIYSEEHGSIISCRITPEYLDTLLSTYAVAPAAVYITSPDYLGNMSDIEGLARVCHMHGTLLLVDNAHGAYLNFLENSAHPIAMGADMCADSAHKTLPVLTGGAYLHISKNNDERTIGLAECAMSLFASTSPSYLILQSLDRANEYISGRYRERLALTVKRVNSLKERLVRCGYTLQGSEALKITVNAAKYGYTGIELAKILSDSNVVCEFADPDFAVMMVTTETDVNELELTQRVLIGIKKRNELTVAPPLCAPAERVMSIRDAMMSPSTEVPLCESVGQVLASARIGCPPAVPIVICGERISKEHIALFEYYGIEKCRIVTK